MGDKSRIQWTDATWNPVTGCSHVSPGCEHCYAEALSQRRGWTAKPWGAQHAAANVHLHPERLGQPLRWRRPRRVFVNSMSDLFHERVPDAFIAAVFGVMAACPEHTFQVLTKRPERMAAWLRELSDAPLTLPPLGRAFSAAAAFGLDLTVPARPAWPLPNVWLGVSAEDQLRWDQRIERLGACPAAVRFVSAEPLLSHIDAGNAFDLVDEDAAYRPVDWVIVGGESGPHARACSANWVRSLVSQCQLARVPVFVKQMGSRVFDVAGTVWRDEWPGPARADLGAAEPGELAHVRLRHRMGGEPSEWPLDLRVREWPHAAR